MGAALEALGKVEIEPLSTADPRKLFHAHAKTNSRVANRADRLDQADGRLAVTRRYRDVVRRVLIDLGGEDCVTEVKLGLVRRYAGLVALSETIEQRMAAGEAISIGEYVLLASAMVRLASRIGLNREARDLGVVPTLAQYLSQASGTELSPDGTELPEAAE
jgi:hypothetical protein